MLKVDAINGSFPIYREFAEKVQCGTICISNDKKIIYVKIPDEELKKLFYLFADIKSKEKNKAFNAGLPPVFPSNTSSSLVGAHITLVNKREIEKKPDVVPFFEKLCGTSINLQYNGIEKVIPPFWNRMEKIWILNVESDILKKFREEAGLTELINEHSFHITFACRLVNSAYEPELPEYNPLLSPQKDITRKTHYSSPTPADIKYNSFSPLFPWDPLKRPDPEEEEGLYEEEEEIYEDQQDVATVGVDGDVAYFAWINFLDSVFHPRSCCTESEWINNWETICKRVEKKRPDWEIQAIQEKIPQEMKEEKNLEKNWEEICDQRFTLNAEMKLLVYQVFKVGKTRFPLLQNSL